MEAQESRARGYAAREPADGGAGLACVPMVARDTLMELDRPADAVGQFRTLQGVYNAPNWMLAYYRLGQAYAQLGETENAREQYAYFVDAWEEAAPELQPLVEKARARLRELAGSRD